MMIEYNGTVLRNEVAISKEKIYRSQVRSPGMVIEITGWICTGKSSFLVCCLFDSSGWDVLAAGEYKVKLSVGVGFSIGLS